MSRSLLRLLPTLVLGVAVQVAPGAAHAQSNESYSGAFARQYPEATELLNGFRVARAALLEQLYADPSIAVEQLEGATFGDFAEQMRDGEDDAVASIGSLMPNFAGYAPALVQVFDHAHTLQTDIYDIYADSQVTDKTAATEAAVDRYLSRSDVALSPTKKSMTAMTEEDHDMHAMHEMPEMGFQARYPKTNGVLWASNWLQLAIFDPLMYYPEQGEREDGVENTVERFQELVDSPPESTPQEMPTPAAVTPELVRLHPRAAAIFHNLHMLQDEVVSVLTNQSVSDKRMAMNQSLEMFQDPTHMTVSDYDWIVFSLRNGIFYQGGPAIGRLDRPERNMGHMHAGSAIMPGMTAPAGAAEAAPPQDASADDQGGAHQQH